MRRVVMLAVVINLFLFAVLPIFSQAKEELCCLEDTITLNYEKDAGVAVKLKVRVQPLPILGSDGKYRCPLREEIYKKIQEIFSDTVFGK